MTSVPPKPPSHRLADIEREVNADRALARLAAQPKRALIAALSRARFADQIFVRLSTGSSISATRLDKRRVERKLALAAFRDTLPLRLQADAETLVLGGTKILHEPTIVHVDDAVEIADALQKINIAIIASERLFVENCSQSQQIVVREQQVYNDVMRERDSMTSVIRAANRRMTPELRKRFDDYRRVESDYATTIERLCPTPVPGWWTWIIDGLSRFTSTTLGSVASYTQNVFASQNVLDVAIKIRDGAFSLLEKIAAGLRSLIVGIVSTLDRFISVISPSAAAHLRDTVEFIRNRLTTISGQIVVFGLMIGVPFATLAAGYPTGALLFFWRPLLCILGDAASSLAFSTIILMSLPKEKYELMSKKEKVGISVSLTLFMYTFCRSVPAITDAFIVEGSVGPMDQRSTKAIFDSIAAVLENIPLIGSLDAVTALRTSYMGPLTAERAGVFATSGMIAKFNELGDSLGRSGTEIFEQWKSFLFSGPAGSLPPQNEIILENAQRVSVNVTSVALLGEYTKDLTETLFGKGYKLTPPTALQQEFYEATHSVYARGTYNRAMSITIDKALPFIEKGVENSRGFISKIYYENRLLVYMGIGLAYIHDISPGGATLLLAGTGTVTYIAKTTGATLITVSPILLQYALSLSTSIFLFGAASPLAALAGAGVVAVNFLNYFSPESDIVMASITETDSLLTPQRLLISSSQTRLITLSSRAKSKTSQRGEAVSY